MKPKLTHAQCLARFQALDEAAEHLDREWTDDPLERSEGYKMRDWIKAEAKRWLNMADERQ